MERLFLINLLWGRCLILQIKRPPTVLQMSFQGLMKMI